MFLGGIAAGIEQGLEKIDQSNLSKDAHAHNLLAIQQLQQSIKQQDVENTAKNGIIALAGALPTLNFDASGNVIPGGDANVPGAMPTPNMPGVAPIIPPVANIPPNTVPPGQASQPMQPPMPAGGPVPMPPPPGMPMQGGQPPMPAGPPTAPVAMGPSPYVNTAALPNKPALPQQQPPMAPPPLQAAQQPVDPAQGLQDQHIISQAKATLIPDAAFMQLFEIQPTSTEKQIAAYKKAYPAVPYQAILHKLGFTGKDPLKEARTQINTERAEDDRIKSRMAMAYNSLENREDRQEARREKQQAKDEEKKGAEQLTPEGLALAEEFIYAGKSLPGGWSKSGISRGNAILNDMASKQEGGAGSGSVVGSQADYKANQTALTAISKDLAAIKPFKNMLDQNADIAVNLSKKVISTDSGLANKTINYIKSNVGDNPDTREFLAQVAFVQTEAARVLNNPRLVGQLTDSARHEMQEVVDGNMPLNSFERVMERIKNDGKRRVDAMEEERKSLHEKLTIGRPKDQKGSSSPKAISLDEYLSKQGF